jgi:hypothetical protein
LIKPLERWRKKREHRVPAREVTKEICCLLRGWRLVPFLVGNPSAKAALSFALGTLRRHNITGQDFIHEDADVTLARLNDMMAKKQIGADDRMQIKTALARATIIN